MDQEAGGHRIQRVPPTEKGSRVHTSTVTVAIITKAQTNPLYQKRDDSDFYVEWFSGSGAGGQHRNKHQNSCRLYHLPTGLMESRQGRSRASNYKDAMGALIATLDGNGSADNAAIVAKSRKLQVGCGSRADKSVTLRFQDDIATNNLTGKRMSAKKYMRGYMDDLWVT